MLGHFVCFDQRSFACVFFQLFLAATKSFLVEKIVELAEYFTSLGLVRILSSRSVKSRWHFARQYLCGEKDL